jgi:hypothetical protein
MIVRTVVSVAILGSVAAAFACSSSSSGGSNGGGANWAGTYNCTQSESVMKLMLGDASLPDMTLMMSGQLTVTQNGTKLSALTSSDAGTPCMLTFTQSSSSANSATIDPMQTCMGSQSGVNYTIDFSGGTATLSGTSIATNLTFTLSGMLSGMGTQTATCMKM